MNAETTITFQIENAPGIHKISISRRSDTELRVDMMSTTDGKTITENYSYDLSTRKLDRGKFTRHCAADDWIWVKSIPIDKLEVIVTKELVKRAMLDV